MRGPAKSIRYTSKPILATQLITQILCFKLVLCLSLFSKALPRSPVANADAHTTMETAQHGELTTCGNCGQKNHWQAMCRSFGRKNSSTGHSPSPRWPQQQRQRRQSGNKYFKKSKGGGGGSTGYKKATPRKGGKP